MIKVFRLFLIGIAAIFVLLHSMVHHRHNTHLNEEEHISIHHAATGSPLHLLSFIFHEFTNDGDMERYLSAANLSAAPAPLVYLLPDAFPAFFAVTHSTTVHIGVFYYQKQGYSAFASPQDKISGFFTVCGMRPPPYSSAT